MSSFDRVNHDILMTRIGQTIRDKRVLGLIGRYLRAGVGEILIDDFDPILRPAQLQGPLPQMVLAIGGLAVDGDLCRCRLSNIDVGPSLQMSRLNFWIIVHELCLELKDFGSWFGGGPALTSGRLSEG